MPAGHKDKHREIGSEANPAAFLDVLLELTAEWSRVLAPHGTLAVELGDTYSGSGGAGGDYNPGGLRDGAPKFDGSAALARERERLAARAVGGDARRCEYDDLGDEPVPTEADHYALLLEEFDRKYATQWGEGGRRNRPADVAAGIVAPTRRPGPEGRDKIPGWPLAKSLALIPQLYAVALAYGINPLTGQPSPAGRWRVRNVIHWHRPNPPVGALGDKWRPASSAITVACRGPRRWFDLDAVRQPYKNPERLGQPISHTATEVDYDEGVKSAWSNKLGMVVEDRGGAPPLDWHADGDLGVGHIVLSTQPYAGSHYATFPMELPRKIIDCMCPRQVCRVCGVARERVTDSFDRSGVDAMPIRKTEAVRQGGRFSSTEPAGVREFQRETLGWTDCGHDNYRPGTVFDPFVGTGTTLAAAEDLGRDGIGVDIDPDNAWLARERVGMFLDVEDFPSSPEVEDVASPLL